MYFRNVILRANLKGAVFRQSNVLNANSTIRCFSNQSLFPENMTLMDKEKEMFKIKRKIGLYYSKGNYAEALSETEILEKQINETFGTNNPVYASCLNNLALMNKMLGNNDTAMDYYIKALHIYEDTLVVDENHSVGDKQFVVNSSGRNWTASK